MATTGPVAAPQLKVPIPGQPAGPVVPEIPTVPSDPVPAPDVAPPGDPVPPSVPEPDPDRDVPIEPPDAPQTTRSVCAPAAGTASVQRALRWRRAARRATCRARAGSPRGGNNL